MRLDLSRICSMALHHLLRKFAASSSLPDEVCMSTQHHRIAAESAGLTVSLQQVTLIVGQGEDTGGSLLGPSVQQELQVTATCYSPL